MVCVRGKLPDAEAGRFHGFTNGEPVYVIVPGCDGERTGGADNGRFPLLGLVIWRLIGRPGEDSSGLTM